MARRFVRRGRPLGPSRQWTDISESWVHTTVGATASAVLWGLEAPSPNAALTALPPADVVIMRVVGTFSVNLSSNVGAWRLALTVQDKAWTPSSLFRTDADKRILWSQTFDAGQLCEWFESGITRPATDSIPFWSPVTQLDISPKVKLEAGQGLNLVAYEETGTALLTTASRNMRMLWQMKATR